MNRTPIRSSLTLLTLTLPGCLNPSAPPPVRYFDPPVTIAPIERPATPKSVRLTAVTSARMIGEAMTWRLSDLEVAFDDQHRWAEAPNHLVERALRRALFSSGAMDECAGGRTADCVLEVVVAAFENVRAGQRALVRLELRRRNADGSVITREVEAEAEAESNPAGYARAMGVALARAVTQVRDWVVAKD